MFQFKRLPPKEAIAYFRQKGYAIGFSWEDVWQQENQAAFTVAKAMQLDILRDIRDALDSAKADGTTFATFRKNLKPLLVQKGWWGKADMIDPLTGELRKVQLGSTRRLKTIFDTNLRTAHSEGQWERIQRSKDTFPYLIYDANNSEHPRIQHSQWDNLVLPVDDPFWQAHTPVKAWGCKCGVRQANAKMLEQRRLKVGDSPKVSQYSYTNKRTGEIQRVPLGVDPAFNYPPGGRSANLPKFIAEKIIQAPADIGSKWQSVAGISNIYDPYRAMVRDILDADDRRAAGAVRVAHVLPPDTVQDMADRGHALESAAVMLRDRDLVHAIRPTKNDRGQILPESVWLNLPDYLGDADIYLDTQDTALVYAFDVAEDKGKVVVRVNYSEKIRDAEGNRSRVVGNFISTGGTLEESDLHVERYVLLKK